MATVYEMLMRIGLQNNASAGLSAIAHQLGTINNIVNTVSANLGGWKIAIAAVGSALVGSAMLRGFEDLAKHGAEVNHQLEMMKIAGMSTVEMQNAMAAASKTAGSVLTTSLSENLKHINELRTAFGETTDAINHLDEISRANSILNSIRGGGTDQVWEFVKALEGKGLTYDSKEFSSYVDTMTKVVEATGGRVTPQMFMSAFKYGRTATLGWDEEFVGGALGRLIQSMSSGGSGRGGGAGIGGPGNALMTALNAIEGQLTKPAAQAWLDLGLMDPTKVEFSKSGQVANVGPGAVENSQLFLRNPYEWVQSVLAPKLLGQGYTHQQDVIEEVKRLFPNRTAGQIIGEMVLQGRAFEGERSPFEKDIRLFGGAQGLSGYNELIKNDYPTIMRAFHEQWKNLLETIGGPLMAPGGPVIRALSAVTSIMGELGQFAAAHPEAVKTIALAIGGIATALIALGTAGILVAAAALVPGGVVAVAVASVVGVLVALATQIPWDAINTSLSKFRDAMNNMASVAWDSVVSGLTSIKDAIMGFVNWITATAESIRKFLDLSRFIAPIKKTSFEGDESGGVLRGGFNPANQKQILQPIKLDLNLDGRTLAQAVSDVLQDMYEHPLGSASPNGWNSYRPLDANYVGT